MPKISVITPSIRPEYLNITQSDLENQTFQDFEWLTEIGLRNRGYLLSTDLNKMLRRAKGEIVVMLQDCIHIEKDILQKIVDSYDGTFTTYPVGKVMKLEEDPKWDWRKHRPEREIDPHYWEADFASAPLEAFYKIGGYDEEYDKGWSWENVGLAWRAHYAGYKFRNNPDIISVAIDHDALSENPFRFTRVNNDKRSNETRALAELGKWKLNYL